MVFNRVTCLRSDLDNRLKKVEDYENSTYKRKISEIDTQALFVEPVLEAAGWDIYNPFIVKRADRSPRNKLDIKCYTICKSGNRQLYLAIEVKAFSSDEFNVGKSNRFGALKPNGTNYSKDGVGQLRQYCLNMKLKSAKPILTNGQRWAIFGGNFLNRGDAKKKVRRSDFKVYDVTKRDQLKRLLQTIKKPGERTKFMERCRRWDRCLRPRFRRRSCRFVLRCAPRRCRAGRAKR